MRSCAREKYEALVPGGICQRSHSSLLADGGAELFTSDYQAVKKLAKHVL